MILLAPPEPIGPYVHLCLPHRICSSRWPSVDLFATALTLCESQGWSADQVNSTWTFSTCSGSRYTMQVLIHTISNLRAHDVIQVHDPSRIANQVADQVSTVHELSLQYRTARLMSSHCCIPAAHELCIPATWLDLNRAVIPGTTALTCCCRRLSIKIN